MQINQELKVKACTRSEAARCPTKATGTHFVQLMMNFGQVVWGPAAWNLLVLVTASKIQDAAFHIVLRSDIVRSVDQLIHCSYFLCLRIMAILYIFCETTSIQRRCHGV
jgi:hypothetical protein